MAVAFVAALRPAGKAERIRHANPASGITQVLSQSWGCLTFQTAERVNDKYPYVSSLCEVFCY